jgi:hypothetical protein
MRAVYGHQDKRCVGHELNLWFKAMDRNVGDEVVTSFEVSGAQNKSVPHLVHLSEALV